MRSGGPGESIDQRRNRPQRTGPHPIQAIDSGDSGRIGTVAGLVRWQLPEELNEANELELSICMVIARRSRSE